MAKSDVSEIHYSVVDDAILKSLLDVLEPDLVHGLIESIKTIKQFKSGEVAIVVKNYEVVCISVRPPEKRIYKGKPG